MNNTQAHQKLVDDILLQVGRLPFVRVWPVVVGLFRDLHCDRMIKVGLNGMADISGLALINGKGIRIEIECKTGGGKLSSDQIAWKNMIEKYGGLYVQARNVDTVLTAIKVFIEAS